MAVRLSTAELIEGLPVADSEWLAGTDLKARVSAAVNGSACREHWKYSKLDHFIDPLPGQAVVEPRIRGVDQPGIVLTEHPDTRVRVHAQGPADAPSAGRFPLADLGLLITGRLKVLQINRSPAAPLTIDYPDGIAIPLLIELAPGVNVSLIEHACANTFGHHSLYLHLAQGSRLNHARTSLPVQACHWSLSQVIVSAAGHYELQQYCRGGAGRRTETHVVLEGREAQAHLTGAYVVDGGSHLDQQVVIEHRAPDTLSRQRFNGIGAGKGTTVFNGRIHIHPHSPRSDATLSNRNLALHPEAQINTKPELEIYTDDVKCAHGATVGQISAESLFYLQSRGVDETRARQMLCRAFVRECINGPVEEEAAAALLGDWLKTAADSRT